MICFFNEVDVEGDVAFHARTSLCSTEGHINIVAIVH